jgi:hypothetical protein
MSEPTSALSIEDLVLRVARESGIAFHGADGQERAMIPVDPHNLDQCLRVVNEGVRLFITSTPKAGWRWMRRTMSVTMTATRVTGAADSGDSITLVDASLTDAYPTDGDLTGWFIYIDGSGSYAQITDYTGATGTITVAGWLDVAGNIGGVSPDAADTFAITPVETVGGDIHRYPLAENFGGSVDGEISYEANTNHATHIDWVDESFIRRRRSVTVTTSYPLWAAIKPLEPYTSGAGPARRFEILFSPSPVSDDTILFPYSAYHNEVRLISGEASSGDNTTLIDSELVNIYPDDYYNGWTIKVISGTGKFSNALVTGYEGSTGTFTVADWLFVNGVAGGTNPSNDSFYVAAPPANLHPAGYRFDSAVKSACMASAELEVEDLEGRGFLEKFYKVDLKMAHNLDSRSGPRSLGSSNKSGRGRTLPCRFRNDVTFN